MTPGTARMPAPRENHTIILPIGQDEYTQIIPHPPKFRVWIDEQFLLNPELFPETFDTRYKLHDKKTSEKTGVMPRRIELRNGEVWTIHPSFVMPYMTGFTADVAKILLLRKWSVPYEVLADLFGRDANYWYRLETQFGRKSVVATTTIKTVPVRGRCCTIIGIGGGRAEKRMVGRDVRQRRRMPSSAVRRSSTVRRSPSRGRAFLGESEVTVGAWT